MVVKDIDVTDIDVTDIVAMDWEASVDVEDAT
jgi:hypothetical protein